MADCFAGLDSIEKFCGGGNAPGLKTTIWIAGKVEITAIPAADVDTSVVSTDFTMRVEDAVGPPVVAAGVFKTIAISKINGSWKVEPVGEGENISYKVTIEAFVNKISSAASYSLNATTGGEFIVLAQDKNGEKRIVGDLDEGASIKVGEQTNDANGYPITIEWDTPNLPLFYEGTIVT